MKAVVYARVSTEEQGLRYSLDDQVRRSREYAATHGFDVAAELRDEVSGSTLERPGLQRALELIRAGEAGVLVCLDVDRLSRETLTFMLIEEAVTKAGGELAYVLSEFESTPEGTLFKEMRVSFAAYDRRKIIWRTTTGKIAKARAGQVVGTGAAAFGYRYVLETRGNRTVRTGLALDPEQADLVREFFLRRARGDSFGTIARWAATQTGRRWNPAVVSGILKNSVHMGRWAFRKTDKWGKGRPRDEWIFVDVPPIVEPALWAAAQEIQRVGRLPTKHQYLLAGLIRCGGCGHKMTGTSGLVSTRTGHRLAYYRCARCKVFTRADRADEYGWKTFGRVLKGQSFLEALVKHSGRSGGRGVEAATAKLQKLKAKKTRLHTVYLEGGMSRAEYRERLAQLEQGVREQEAQVDRLRVAPSGFPVFATIEDAKSFVAAVRRALTKAKEFERRRRLAQILGRKIEIVYMGADPHPMFTYHRHTTPDSTSVSSREC